MRRTIRVEDHEQRAIAVLRSNPRMAESLVAGMEKAAQTAAQAEHRATMRHTWDATISTLATLTGGRDSTERPVELRASMDAVEDILRSHPDDLIRAVRAEVKRRDEAQTERLQQALRSWTGNSI